MARRLPSIFYNWMTAIGSLIAVVSFGMVMLLYLHNSYNRRKSEGRMNNLADLKAAIHEGAVLRIRPMTMTAMTMMMGLVPIMIGSETGSDVMKRLAAPMFGGLLTGFAIVLLVYPVIFLAAKQFEVRRMQRRQEKTEAR